MPSSHSKRAIREWQVECITGSQAKPRLGEAQTSAKCSGDYGADSLEYAHAACSPGPWDIGRSWKEGIGYACRPINCNSIGEGKYFRDPWKKALRKWGCDHERGGSGDGLELLTIKGWAT